MGGEQNGVHWLTVVGIAVLSGDGRGQLGALRRPKGESAKEVAPASLCLN